MTFLIIILRCIHRWILRGGERFATIWFSIQLQREGVLCNMIKLMRKMVFFQKMPFGTLYIVSTKLSWEG